MNDRNRCAPVTLPGNAPVTQAISHFLFTQTFFCQNGCDGIDCFLIVQPVETTGIDTLAVFLVGIPFMPFIFHERLAIDVDNLTDRQAVFMGEFKVAFIVGRYCHDSAVTVAHQHVVTDPDFNQLVGQGMIDEQTGWHPFFLHRGHIGFDDTAPFAFFNEFRQFRIVFCSETGKIVFGCNCTESDPLDRVGAGRENPEFSVADQLSVRIMNVVSESETDAFGFADPVDLHGADPFRPARELVRDVVQQFFRIIGNAGVVHRDFTFFDQCTRTPATAVNHLFIGENSLVNRVPVNSSCFLVNDAFFQHLQKHPLVPFVIIRFTSRHFT